MTIHYRSLMGRLDETARGALDGALALCVANTHYVLELEHWLGRLLEVVGGDAPRILQHFGLSPEGCLRDLAVAISRFRRDNAGRPELAPELQRIVERAWMLSSINYDWTKIRSGAIWLSALSDPATKRRLVEIHRPLARINVETLENTLPDIVAGSVEDGQVASASPPALRDVPHASGAGSRTPALDQFTVDLTAAARAGEIDPVLGRDAEIRQVVDILTRKRQNNPILTGEAGVGKTAIVDGFALRIAAGDVPGPLRDVVLRTLDLGLLQAGAGVKGEFENRLKMVIEEVRGSARKVVLFIDEAHTMIGAGGQAGQSDAANLLKPALARGELRTIAATTWAEYKKYFEKDPALARRFQVIKVEEPSEAAAIQMMRGVKRSLEAHHGVEIQDAAIEASVRLSHRYIPARQLPEKCLGVLDTACARVAMGRHAVPGAIEDLSRSLENLVREREVLEREASLGADHRARLAELARLESEEQASCDVLTARWQQEMELVAEIRDLRTRILGAADTPIDRAEPTPCSSVLRAELAERREALAKLQQDRPLVACEVDEHTVAAVIAGWTGIPIGRMVADEIRVVLDLPRRLALRVIGQDHALEAIARRIRTARANLDHPQRPQGVFLLVGPSGVGKSETAAALAEALYGGERNLISINMSEYQEAHTVSSLKGSPPGYVGYGEGGVLTEAVRRRPHAVVLLDEVEKAHPDVMELFFQVFDKGVLEDGEGREVDFKNTIILLGSNVGADTITALCEDPELRPEPEPLVDALSTDLSKVFPAALLGRMVTVPYYPLSREVLRRIVRLQLDRIAERVAIHHGAKLAYDEAVIDVLESRCNDRRAGARAIDRILTHSLLPQVSGVVLARMADKRDFKDVGVHVAASGELEVEIA